MTQPRSRAVRREASVGIQALSHPCVALAERPESSSQWGATNRARDGGVPEISPPAYAFNSAHVFASVTVNPVIVVAHPHVAMDAVARPPAHLSQGRQKHHPILLAQEDSLAPIPTAEHMVKCSRIFDANAARHHSFPLATSLPIKPDLAHMHGLPPCRHDTLSSRRGQRTGRNFPKVSPEKASSQKIEAAKEPFRRLEG